MIWKEHIIGKKTQILVYRRRILGPWKKVLQLGERVGINNFVIEVAPVQYTRWAIYTYDHHRRRLSEHTFETPESAMAYYDLAIA